jgi:hypothetical protein
VVKKASIQVVLESMLRQLGDQVARGLSEGIATSGVMKKLDAVVSRITRGSAPAAASRAGRRKAPKVKASRKRKGARCSARGCNKPARAKGLCSKHYQRQRYADKHPHASKRVRVKKVSRKKVRKAAIRSKGTCSVKDCGKPARAKGLCAKHFMEWVRSKKSASA